MTFEQAASGERAARVGAFSERLEEQAGCFYIVPARKYKFVAAVEARDEAPFDGIWFCGGLPEGGEGSEGGEGGALQALRAAYDKKRAKRKARRRSGGADAADADAADADAADALKSPSSPTLVCSLAELRATGLLPSMEDARTELSDAEQARRKRALAALDDDRRADPLRAARKRQKLTEQRAATKATFGRELTPAERERVVGGRACQHFFLGPGCTRAAKCRFAHAVDGVVF